MHRAADSPIRYHRALWDICIDEDASDVGFVLVLVDDDETLFLLSQETFDLLADFDRLNDLCDWCQFTTSGERPLPAWMLTPKLTSHTLAQASLGEDDVVRQLAQPDADAATCAASPHCLQDVVHRDRGYPICAYHDTWMGEVEALLGS